MSGDSAEKMFHAIAQPDAPKWLVYQTDLTVRGARVGVARDPSGRPALLVPAPGMKAGVRLATTGLDARVGALAQGDDLADWLMVICQSPHFDRTFLRLCDDVLATLEQLDDPDKAVDAAMAVVEGWRELLSDAPTSQLSLQQCAGLLAELHALEQLTEILGGTRALESWAGPDRARIDFRFASMGIEVKATLQRDRFKVTVHGLWQLDASQVGDLYVFAQQLEVVPGGGDSLPQAVERLVRAGVSESGLRESMSAIGYSSTDEEFYRSVQFKVLAERGLKVTAQTPKIVKASFSDPQVPEAISSVTYALDLTDLTAAQGRRDEPRSVFAEVAR